MAKHIEEFTLCLKVTCTDEDPDNWVIQRTGCDHVIGDTVAVGAHYPKTSECASEFLTSEQKGSKDAAGDLIKYAQDAKVDIETAEGLE